MVAGRTRIGRANGQICGAPPGLESDFCFWHDPAKSAEAAEARRLGGQHRRRERVVASAFAFEGLGSIATIRRPVEVAVVDTLGLENSIARSRTLADLAQVATRLLEAGEFEDRLQAVESVLERRPKNQNRRGR